jgi:hypothetical protein
MTTTENNKYVKALPYLFIALYFCICCFVALTFNGTNDSGDSVMHFLFSRYAFTYPAFFFHHWAKPVFVLLSAPFSQFGMVGIKLFNCLVSATTLLFTYLTAKQLNKEKSWIVLLMFCFAPLNFTLTFSGLTEPLFALFLIASIFFVSKNKMIAAAVILSFMPLVRSEGLIIAGVFAFYFIYNRNYKTLPFLLAGHVIYSIAGYFVHHDLLWVFTKIPYAKLSSTYGSGELMHFVNQMTYVTGVPIYAFLILGTLALILALFLKRIRNFFADLSFELIIIYGCFFTFLIAHSLFWYFGIFNSMGLKRVLVGVMPCIALIALNGFTFLRSLLNSLNNKLSIALQIILIVYIIIFPFTKNPAAIHLKSEFGLNDEQKLCLDVATFLKNTNATPPLYYHVPYMNLTLNTDPFDKNRHREISDLSGNEPAKGSIVIWDNWWAVVEDGISKEKFTNDSDYTLLKSFSKGEREMMVFRYKKIN